MPSLALDDFDRALLRLIQRDARASVQELAEQVGLSASPCWRRLKRLEEAGLIRGHVALLEARALGLRASAYVHVSLIDHSEASIARFHAFIAGEDHVIDCASITGAADYVLKVVAEDAEALERFLMKRLLALGVVRASNTFFVLRQTKSTTALPVG